MKKRNESVKALLIYSLFPASQFFLLFPRFFAKSMAIAPGEMLWTILLMLMCLIADGALAVAVRLLRKNAELRTKKDSLDRQIELQEEYCRSLTEHYMHLRIIRHDLANHVYAVRILAEENRVEEAAAYIDQLQDNMKIADDMPDAVPAGGGQVP